MDNKEVNVMACLDRIEGRKAVLLVGEDERVVPFPLKYLPKGVQDGDYLNLTISYDEEATLAALEEMNKMLDELRDED